MILHRNSLLGLCITFFVVSCASTKEVSSKIGSPKEIEGIAQEVYLYGYPLVVMSVTKEVATAVPRPGQARAPINQLSHSRTLPNERFKDIASPSVDSLATSAWLDLSQEPQVLSVPESGGRYYLFPLFSAWTEVIASPGPRTTGTHRGDFAITGPGWSGNLPDNVHEIKSPTNIVWLRGRIQLIGKGDFERLYRFQDQMRLTPLSQFGKNISPPAAVAFNFDVDTRTPPVEQVDAMDARTFFLALTNELKMNPPVKKDEVMREKLASIGIIPGKEFEYTKLGTEVQRALNIGYFAGQEKLADLVHEARGPNVSNWEIQKVAGLYGNNYEARALSAKLNLGSNLKQDEVMSRAFVDSSGEQLHGANKYTLRFARGQMPPVNGFWSVTVYNSRQFLTKNSLNRFALNDRDKIKMNRDGSLDIYLQSTNPGRDKEANWLPVPDGEDFNVALRMYWPKQALLDGSWKLPVIDKVPEFKKLSENLH